MYPHFRLKPAALAVRLRSKQISSTSVLPRGAPPAPLSNFYFLLCFHHLLRTLACSVLVNAPLSPNPPATSTLPFASKVAV